LRFRASGNIAAVSGHVDDIAREVESLHGELEDARSRALAQEQALAQLEEQRAETADRLELAQRQIADLGRQVERRQAELEEARQQALLDAFVEAVARRDAAVLEATTRLDAAMEALALLQRRRQEAADALGNVPPRFDAALPDEPGELEEAWSRLVAVVRADLEYKLEDDLVEAAARSPGGRAIQDLPAHLRELARERRRELQKRSRQALRQSEPA
jgi:hypothetical protein